QDQERQRQHLDGGVAVDELADGPGGEQHHQHRQDDGDGHDGDLADKAHRGDHRVQREDDIEHRDLHQDHAEAGGGNRRPGGDSVAALQAVVDLVGGLEQQEQAAADENDVAPGDFMVEDAEQGVGEAHHPGDAGKQQQSGGHGKAEAEVAGHIALVFRQAAHQDGDEDDVVDAEDDFQGGEGGESHPGLGAGEPFEHTGFRGVVG